MKLPLIKELSKKYEFKSAATALRVCLSMFYNLIVGHLNSIHFGINVCSHVYSQHEVVNDCKNTVPFKFLQLKCILITPTYMGLDLCFKLTNGSLI